MRIGNGYMDDEKVLCFAASVFFLLIMDALSVLMLLH